MHILSDGYSPAECFVEFVATGEFPETSSTDGVQNKQESGAGCYSRVQWFTHTFSTSVFHRRGKSMSDTAGRLYRMSAWVMK